MTVGILGGPHFTQASSIHPQPAVQYAALGVALEMEQLSEKRSQGQETRNIYYWHLCLHPLAGQQCDS